MGKQKEPPFEFAGFRAPSYTQVPDALFDELLHVLSGAELKILLYILRRTFGFKKAADSISYRQMLDGIVTHDGRRLDYGAGIKSRSTVSSALKGLEEKNIIIAERRSSQENGQETTVYRPNMGSSREPISDPHSSSGDPQNDPGSKIEPTPSTKNEPGGSPKIVPGRGSKNGPAPGTKIKPAPVQKSNSQETEQQETEQQQVVVALTEAGLSGQVAQKLVSRFGVERVREKLAYLAYQQKSRRDPIKRPAGWLRQAIEQDYSAPDGFETFGNVILSDDDETEVVVNRPRPRRPTAETEKQAAETSMRERLRERCGWRPADQEVWSNTMGILDATLPTAQLSYFAGADLVSTQDGRAVVAVGSARAQAWMTARYCDRIVHALRQGGAAVTDVTFIVFDEFEGLDRPAVQTVKEKAGDGVS